MTEEIIIKPNFDFKTVFKANLYMYYSKPLNIIVTGFYILFFFSFIALYFLLDNQNNSEAISDIFKSPFFYIIILLPLFRFFLIYYSSKTQLKNNYRLNEDFEFIFNKDFFQEKGETFDIKHYWDKLIKIKERKNYFLIYQTKKRANIIPKNSFNKNQLDDFRNLINSLEIKKNIFKQ